jgi:hypothetical protein
MVAHTFNPSYLGGGDPGGLWLNNSQEICEQDLISTNKLCVVVHTCNLSYAGGHR